MLGSVTGGQGVTSQHSLRVLELVVSGKEMSDRAELIRNALAFLSDPNVTLKFYCLCRTRSDYGLDDH